MNAKLGLYKLFFWLLINSTLVLNAQTQIGSSINGEANYDKFGHSTSISANGKRVAVGAYYNDALGSQTGSVRVYENMAGTWTQLGSDMDGENANDESGFAISLSADGNTVAIGAVYATDSASGLRKGHVRVFKFVAGTWVKLGNDIDGEYQGENNGYSVSISDNGQTVAIGADYNNTGSGYANGHVRIYDLVSNTWTQRGADIDGNVLEYVGHAVSLSSDGNTVAIGANGYNNLRGYCAIYKFISGAWTQLGSNIIGENVGDQFGHSVSLSDNGNIVAVGALYNDGGAGGTQRGHARVFELISGVWNQIGADIDGVLDYDFFGSSVSLSADGSVLGIGASGHGDWGSYVDIGQFKLYKNEGGNWNQKGNTLYGDSTNNQFGTSVALAAGGTIAIVGSPFANGNGTEKGKAQVYYYGPVLTVKGNNNTILNKDTLISKKNNTNFLDLNSCANTTHTFTIYNTGLDTLKLMGANPVKIAGLNANDFTITAMPSSIILAGDSSNFTVTNVNYTALVKKEAEISIIALNTDTFRFKIGNSGALSIVGSINEHIGGVSTISNNGKIVAIGVRNFDGAGIKRGQVRIYEISNGTWNLLGATIDGLADYEQIGASVSLSSNGQTVSIGSIGFVRVYNYISGNWVQVGSDITGVPYYDFGATISMSTDGQIVAIGSPKSSVNFTYEGHISVYKFISGNWVQQGANIVGTAEDQYLGQKLNISNDGLTLATLAYDIDSAYAIVYNFSGGSWNQVGSKIIPTFTHNPSLFSIVSIALSGNGKTIALGSPGALENHVYMQQSILASQLGTQMGMVQVFENISGNWVAKGQKIVGKESRNTIDGANIGFSVSLSDSGDIVACNGLISSSFYNFNGNRWTKCANNIVGFDIANGIGYKLNGNGNLFLGGNQFPYDFDLKGKVDIYKICQKKLADIEISGNNYNINNHDTIKHITENNRFFGNKTNCNTLEKTFRIFNAGSDTLKLNGNNLIEISGLNNSDFSITNMPTSKINPFDSTFFTVSFNPTTIGMKYANIIIKSNASDNEFFEFGIQANYSTQIGNTIAANGKSVSALSKDGKTMAIATEYSPTFTYQNIKLDIYKNMNDSWVLYAQDSLVSGVSNLIVNNLSIAGNGQKIAISYRNDGWQDSVYVKVYDISSNLFTSMGFPYVVPTYNSIFTYLSNELSNDGLSIAIGYRDDNNYAGVAKVFNYISGNWVQQGADINGGIYEKLGTSVSISDNGNIISIGAPGANSENGKALVYEFISGNWSQLGSDITTGSYTNAQLGSTVSLASDGLTLAIAAPGLSFSSNGLDSRGKFIVVKYIAGTWTQVGTDILGKKTFEQTSSSLRTLISLSDSGNRIAVLIPNKKNIADYQNGTIRIYDLISNNWVQVFNDFEEGLSINDLDIGYRNIVGKSISISGNGNYVSHCFDGFIKGEVIVYKTTNEKQLFEIKGNAQLITNNDLTPSFTDSTNFGMSSVAKTKSFKIYNTGIVPLFLDTIYLNGLNPSQFTLDSATKAIAVGDSGIIKITYLATSTGINTAIVNLSTTECTNQIFTFKIQAEKASNCNLMSSLPTLPGVYTSTQSGTDSNFTCYCDINGSLLLAIDSNGTGTKIPNNGVSLEIGNTATTAWNNAGGIITNVNGGAIFNRKWNVVPTTQPTSPVKVKYFFTNTEYDSVVARIATMGTVITSPTQLEMYKLFTGTFADPHASTATGIILTNGATPTVTIWTYAALSTNHSAEFLVNSFSGGGGGAGAAAAALPVSFISFTAKGINQNSALLKWQTASEVNNSYFNVERSLNGNNFVKIGTVKANSNVQGLQNYTFTDYSIENGTSKAFYKIKQVDINGKNTSTNIQLVNFNQTISSINVYPNPFYQILTLNLHNEESANVTIIDATGKIVFKSQVTAANNTLNLTNLNSGFYSMAITTNSTIKNIKIIKN